MPTTVGKSKNAKKTTKKTQEERPILYPEPVAKVEDYTYEEAMELLGWQVEPEGGEWGDDYLLLDLQGRKVRCSNNWNNRPFTLALALTYKQEILRKRWRLNGETCIIGQTGVVLSAQHRLIGFVLACEAYNADPDKFNEWWAETPTLRTFVAYGISEDDETVNTIDVGKRRSFSDVAARSELFASLSSKDRKAAAKMIDHAVKLLWHRTGAKEDALAPVRTHAESWEFVQRHKRLVSAVKHVLAENENRRIEKYLSPGYASAMLYLMGTSATDSGEYLQVRSEDVVSFDHWDAAEEFFTLLSSGTADFKPVREALSGHMNDDVATLDVRLSVLVKAWARHVEGKKVTPDSLELLFETDKDGIRTLASVPYLGGLDVGKDASEAVVPGDEIEEAEAVTEAEVQAEAQAIRKANLRKKAAENKKPSNGKAVAEQDEVWVWPVKKNEGAWHGTVVEIMSKRGASGKRNARVKVSNGQAGAGTVYEVDYAQLHHDAPVE